MAKVEAKQDQIAQFMSFSTAPEGAGPYYGGSLGLLAAARWADGFCDQETFAHQLQLLLE